MKSEKREYVWSFAELLDRLSVITQKIIYSENEDMQAAFKQERDNIVHDIDLYLEEGVKVTGKSIEAIMTLQLVNSHIWENESAFRGDGEKADLIKTHKLNSDRASMKRFLQESCGGRIDYKLNYGLGIWKYPF